MNQLPNVNKPVLATLWKVYAHVSPFDEFQRGRANVGHRSEKTNKFALNICYLRRGKNIERERVDVERECASTAFVRTYMQRKYSSCSVNF